MGKQDLLPGDGLRSGVPMGSGLGVLEEVLGRLLGGRIIRAEPQRLRHLQMGIYPRQGEQQKLRLGSRKRSRGKVGPSPQCVPLLVS